jgi:class 3 adenylate cyclase
MCRCIRAPHCDRRAARNAAKPLGRARAFDQFAWSVRPHNMRFDASAIRERGELPLLIAFLDLTRFAAMSQRASDEDLAAILDDYYRLVDHHIGAAGGHVVKFMGDGALVVFHESAADAAVEAMIALKEAVDDAMDHLGWECRLMVKAHTGTAVVGRFGAEGRIDVIGQAVNTAAMLDSTGVALSVDAFRSLGKEARTRFRKHSPPITYIRHEDPRRLRYRPA